MMRLAALYLSLSCTTATFAETSWVFVLPQALNEKTQKESYTAFLSVLSEADVGDVIHVLSGQRGERVTYVEVPKQKGRARLRRTGREIRKLEKYLEQTRSTHQESAEQLGIPRLLKTIGSLPRSGAGETRCYFLGSPFHQEKRDQRWSWGGGVVPNDAFITYPSAESLYGTADLRKSLTNVTIHFSYVREERFLSFREQRATERFLALYFDELGVRLATFSASRTVPLERMLKGISDRVQPNAKLDRTVKDLHMVRYAGEEPKEEAPSAPPPPRPVPDPKPTPKEEAPETPQPLPEPTSKPKKTSQPEEPKKKASVEEKAIEETAQELAPPPRGFVRIAVFWCTQESQPIDVDLYVKAHPKAKELYFGLQETEEGRHMRDVVESQEGIHPTRWNATAEVVEVKEAALGELSCFVHLYSKQHLNSPVKGLVRLVAQGRSVDVPFSVVRREGGDDLPERSGPEWQKIDLLAAWEKTSPEKAIGGN